MYNYNALHGTKPLSCHTYIVPVRYPESDSLPAIDLVQFHLDKPVSHLTLIGKLEAAYAESGSSSDDSRLEMGEAAFDKVAAHFNGAWEYLKTDAHCAEFY